MERLDPEALLAQVGQAVEEAAEQIEEAQAREFVGTAADDMVTARVSGGQLDIEIHVLAKRRLERDELGEAVVQAVQEAERQVSEATFEIDPKRRAGSDTSDQVRTELDKAMRHMRGRMPF